MRHNILVVNVERLKTQFSLDSSVKSHLPKSSYTSKSRNTKKRCTVMYVLKEREKLVLDTVAKSYTVKQAAQKLKMSERTVYNILYRLRKKQVAARKYINTLLGYRRSSPILDKVLSRRITLEEEKEELE